MYLSCVFILCICASAWVALAGTGPQISIEAILFVYLCTYLCIDIGHIGTGPKMPIKIFVFLYLCNCLFVFVHCIGHLGTGPQIPIEIEAEDIPPHGELWPSATSTSTTTLLQYTMSTSSPPLLLRPNPN